MPLQAIGLIAPNRLTRAGRSGEGITGAETAGMSTVEALARYGSLPYRLYAVRATLPGLRSELASLSLPLNRDLHSLSNLGNHLETGDLFALHTYTSDLHPLVAVRSHYENGIVPFTCMQYSISQISVHHSNHLHFFLADLYPCDTVLCTTQVSRQAQLNILSRIAEALEPKVGKLEIPLRHEVIPYPIDTDYFHPPSPEQKRFARQSLGLPLSGILALYVGRFDPASKSDLQPLLLAFRSALKRLNKEVQGTDAHLVLAGYDPSGQVPFLQKLAEEYGFADRLHVHTDYPPSQQALYYHAADLFVSLSDTLQENFGLTPVEAMACGLPVVVSDWAGYQETVEHDVTGFKVRTLWAPADADLVGLSGLLPWTETHLPLSQAVLVDPEEVADRLFTLLSNETLRAKMGAAARQRVLERYASPVVVAQMEALWQELSEQASTLEKRPAPEVSLYETPYGRDLLPYAAGLLPHDARLLLTDYGREVLGGGVSLPYSEAMAGAFDAETLNGLLGALKSGSLLNRGLPLSELASQSSRKYGRSQPAAVRHLTWLVKHGLASLK